MIRQHPLVTDQVQDLEARVAQVPDSRTKIDLLNDLAWELRDSDRERSRELSEAACELSSSVPAGESPYVIGMAGSLRALGFWNIRVGNFHVALSQSMQALAHLEGVTAPALKADVLRNLAETFMLIGNHADGLAHAYQALALVRERGDLGREAFVLDIIGALYTGSGDSAQALRTFAEVLPLYRALGHTRGEAIILNNQAMTYLAIGELDRALEASLAALRLARDIGFTVLDVTATSTVGEVYLAMGDHAQASAYFEQCLLRARQHGFRRDELWGLLLLGEVAQRQQQYQLALSHLGPALALANELGARSEQVRCHKLLAEVHEQQGNLKEALAHFKRFHETNELVFNFESAQKIANLGVIYQVETAKRDAEINFLKTIELQKEIQERKHAQEALQHLATTDSLTGLLNRREFFIRAERAFDLALCEPHPLSAILFDLDYFKRINDTYGHAMGDQVLVSVAKILRDNTRRNEIAGRYGGDEFVILLPGSDLAAGQKLASRLKLKFTSELSLMPLTKVLLQVSMGVSACYDDCASLDLLLEHADKAMYAAKRAGRNRIVAY